MTARKVCLVDDDVVLLDALAIGLRDAGYEVLTAAGAAAGLDVIERYGADALVSDIRMPNTSGAQLIREARARWPSLPIVAISGAGLVDDVDARDLAFQFGADALLIKPFKPGELVDALERAALRSRLV